MINFAQNYQASYLAGLATNSNWESAKNMIANAIKSDEIAIEQRYWTSLHKTDYVSMKASLMAMTGATQKSAYNLMIESIENN